MYTLIKSVSLRYLVAAQIPALGISFIVAEMFYKFHSFTLECLAFLATWFVIDATISGCQNYLNQQSDHRKNNIA